VAATIIFVVGGGNSASVVKTRQGSGAGWRKIHESGSIQDQEAAIPYDPGQDSILGRSSQELRQA